MGYRKPYTAWHDLTKSPNCGLQFRIYIGLLQQVPGPVQETTPDADARSDDSDTDDDDPVSGDQDVVNRLESFLNDPELSMKIFFSSYFREKGLIW